MACRNPKTTAIAIRSLYAVCMAGGAFNHARIVLAHGLGWDYGGVHPLLALFWTALTFIDPLALAMVLATFRAAWRGSKKDASATSNVHHFS